MRASFPSVPISGAERARIVRAIWAYSNLDQKSLAKTAGMTYSRLRAIMERINPSEATLDELVALTEAVGIPQLFALEGFEPLNGYQQLAVDVADIRTKLRALEDRTVSRADVEMIVTEVRRNAVAAPRPQSEGGRGRPEKGA